MQGCYRHRRAFFVGGGGREHILAWGMARGPYGTDIFAAPGNPGVAQLGTCFPDISVMDFERLIPRILEIQPDLVVIGPENPLDAGIVDLLTGKGIVTFGPTRSAAQLETSKLFGKDVMKAAGVLTAGYKMFESDEELLRYGASLTEFPTALKADGLCFGKGVVIGHNFAELQAGVAEIRATCPNAGRLFLEDFLEGEELLVMAISDGEHAVILPAARDHKPIFDGNKGPNTGGMGAFSPVPGYDDAWLMEVAKSVILPILAEMKRRGRPFVGCLYAGLKITPDGRVWVLEFNVRWGDPEAQVIVPRLDEDLFELLYLASKGQLRKTRLARVRPEAAVCVVLASKGYPGKAITGLPIRGLETTPDANPIIIHAATKKTPEGYESAGGRVACVVGLAPTLEEAVGLTYGRTSQVEFEGQYRTDIGRN